MVRVAFPPDGTTADVLIAPCAPYDARRGEVLPLPLLLPTLKPVGEEANRLKFEEGSCDVDTPHVPALPALPALLALLALSVLLALALALAQSDTFPCMGPFPGR